MPKQNEKQSPQPGNGDLLGFFSLPDGEINGWMKNARETWENAFKTFSDETLRFVNQRLEHTGEAVRYCKECNDVNGFIAAQQKYLSDLAHDYYDESRRLTEVTRKIFSDGLHGYNSINPEKTDVSQTRETSNSSQNGNSNQVAP